MQMIIFCCINQFSLNHPIYMVDSCTGNQTLLTVVDSNDLGHTIVTYSHDKKISEVVLSGASEAYLDRFIDDIYTINNLMYNGRNEIKVSIIEGEEN